MEKGFCGPFSILFKSCGGNVNQTIGNVTTISRRSMVIFDVHLIGKMISNIGGKGFWIDKSLVSMALNFNHQSSAAGAFAVIVFNDAGIVKTIFFTAGNNEGKCSQQQDK